MVKFPIVLLGSCLQSHQPSTFNYIGSCGHRNMKLLDKGVLASTFSIIVCNQFLWTLQKLSHLLALVRIQCGAYKNTKLYSRMFIPCTYMWMMIDLTHNLKHDFTARINCLFRGTNKTVHALLSYFCNVNGIRKCICFLLSHTKGMKV